MTNTMRSFFTKSEKIETSLRQTWLILDHSRYRNIFVFCDEVVGSMYRGLFLHFACQKICLSVISYVHLRTFNYVQGQSFIRYI